MPKLKSNIIRYLALITVLVMAAILVVSIGARSLTIHAGARRDAQLFFSQMDGILADYNANIAETTEDYENACVEKARSAAYIIERDPDMLTDRLAMKNLALMLDIDELNIFDRDGVIIAGTVPEYFGLSMEDGDQIGFFKPMLKDKSLVMIQPTGTNTAETGSIQYTAVWSDDFDFIVQVGVEYKHINSIISSNSISYIFSVLNADKGVTLYAIDPVSKVIEGSSAADDVGRHMIAVGLPRIDEPTELYAVHAYIKGVYSYCIFSTLQDKLVVYVISRDTMYADSIKENLVMILALVIVTVILVYFVTRYITRFVIRSIDRINENLSAITSGDLGRNVDVNNTQEFAELSRHINEMIGSLLSTTDVLSYILNQTRMNIGVYMYNAGMKFVRFTDYIPQLLDLEKREMQAIAADHSRFETYITALRKHPMEGEESIFEIGTKHVRYLRIDEVIHGNDVLGVIIDMTDEIEKRRRIESERDIDLLTGLMNRRGFKMALNSLFKDPESLGYGVFFMIDADDLKKINDTYGHNPGDRYLKKLADVLSSFGNRRNMAARLGGDEYVLFLYGYDEMRDLEDEVKAFKRMQDMAYVDLGCGYSSIVRFSLGYAYTDGTSDYSSLLRKADDMMYEDKRRRKGDIRAARRDSEVL